MQNFEHQTNVINEAMKHDFYAFFLEQGLGKTRIAINVVERHFTNHRVDAALVITTKGLIGNWHYTELPKHSEVVYHSYAWDKTKHLQKPHANIMQYFIVNIDALLHKRVVDPLRQFFKNYANVALIVDESTIVKNMKAKRTRRVLELAKRCKYRYIMSGTPVTNGPVDLFSQCEILQKGLLGHSSLYSFKGKYCQMETMRLGTRSFDKVVGYKNLDDLTARVQRFASILKKEDCLDLPDKVLRSVPVDFTKEQQQLYEQLRDTAIAEIEGEEITVVNTISLINKLLQICAGQIKLEDGKYVSIPNNKLSTLKDLVDECPGKTIVWTAWAGTREDIMETLGEDITLLPPGIDIEKRQGIIDTWRGDSTKALLASPASAGHGITLVESSNVIYYSSSWNYEHRAQSMDRNHRIGQTENVLYTDLIIPGTAEEKVANLLQDKKNLADQIVTSEQVRTLLYDVANEIIPQGS